MKKKVLATLLALSLLISLFSGITVSAANNGQTLDATLTATPDPVAPNGTITVTIGTTNWSQTIVDGILALDIMLTYDATKLTYGSIALASNQTDVDDANIEVIDTNGVLEITYYDATLAPIVWFSQGDAFVLTFTVKEDATGTASFSLADGNGANDSWIDNTLNPSEGAVVATYPLTATEVTIESAPTDPIISFGTYTFTETIQIENSNYEIETFNNVISGVTPETTIGEFIQGLEVADGAELTFTAADGVTPLTDTDYFTNGTSFVASIGTTTITYIIRVYGDANLDATIDYSDMDAFNLWLEGSSLFTGIGLLGADINNDGCIDYSDMDYFNLWLEGSLTILQDPTQY